MPLDQSLQAQGYIGRDWQERIHVCATGEQISLSTVDATEFLVARNPLADCKQAHGAIAAEGKRAAGSRFIDLLIGDAQWSERLFDFLLLGFGQDLCMNICRHGSYAVR